MKKVSMFLAAVAMVLGLSQCTKEKQPQTIEGEVPITLSVRANNGTRIDVNTGTGAVAFEYGDVVYVANGAKYVGTLTCNGNSSFTGSLRNPTLNEPLYFYFLGNKATEETLEAGISTTCSVVISDQTEKLPVISLAESDEPFTGTGNYTAYFYNKAALVKFDVTTPSSSPVCILGMNNKVTVDFTDNSFNFSQEDEGRIMLPAGSGERWAILLPQASMNSAVAHTQGFAYTGTCGHVPPIWENDYLTEGIEVNVSDHGYVDLGLPSGLLWATCNVGADAMEAYGDYFAWGETTPKNNYDWSTYLYCMGHYDMLTKYCSNANFGYEGFTDDLTILQPEDDAATANWGNDWRMPTEADWQELLDNTTNVWTTQSGVNGKVFTASNGKSIFLPAAGVRRDDNLQEEGSLAFYWSSSRDTGDSGSGRNFLLSSNGSYINTFGRYFGQSVRAVREN